MLDVCKVGAALELFGTSWTAEVGEMSVARRGVVFGRVAHLDEILEPPEKAPSLHNALITSVPTLCPKGVLDFDQLRRSQS